MNSNTPDNADRRSSSTNAGQGSANPASPASGAAGTSDASRQPVAGQSSSGPSSSGPSSSGPSSSGKAPAKTSKKDSAKSAKTGSDWSVFRTVVVLVGLVIAGFGGYYLITGTSGLPETGDGPVNPTLENQFRFFAAMMIGVGAAFVTIAIKFQWANMLWLVCLMVFIGGIGRVLSWAFSGTPHFLLIILMVVELAFPAALLVWHRYIAKTSELRREYAARP